MKNSISVVSDFKVAGLLETMLEEQQYFRDYAYYSLLHMLKGFDPTFLQYSSELKNNAKFRVFTEKYIRELSAFYKKENSKTPQPHPLYDVSLANCICVVLNVLVNTSIEFPIEESYFEDLFLIVTTVLY